MKEEISTEIVPCCEKSTAELSSRLDDISLGHGARIQNNAAAFLNFFPEYTRDWDVGKLYLFCVFHDVGKLMAGKGGDTKIHCQEGRDLAESHPVLRELSDLIFLHHEKWNGAGPFGVEGENIPFYCRFLRILDDYDIMVFAGDSQYLVSREEAIRQLQEKAGEELDPHLTFLAIKVLMERPEIFCPYKIT